MLYHEDVLKGVIKQKESGGWGGFYAQECFRSQDYYHGRFVQCGMSLAHTKSLLHFELIVMNGVIVVQFLLKEV